MKWGYEIAREEFSHKTVSKNGKDFGFEGRFAFQSLAAFAAELTVWNNLWITVRACEYQLRSAVAAKLLSLWIFNLAFWALHLCASWEQMSPPYCLSGHDARMVILSRSLIQS